MPEGDIGRGSVLEAWDTWAETLVYEPDDPRNVLLECGRSLAQMVDEGRNTPRAVSELSGVLNQCAYLDNGPASQIDAIIARHMKRRFESLKNTVQREEPAG
jgi:hypothetical protein